MSKCDECGSAQILSVNAKSSDLSYVEYLTLNHDGYLPEGLGIGGGDYVEMEVCLGCGKVQGRFPISDEAIAEAFGVESLPPAVDMNDVKIQLERFQELHEAAKRDVDGMPQHEWRTYRNLGRDLERDGFIESGVIIK